MKVRIFALAKELDMDSKVLIKHCNDAGVQVKSSALASISPEERDLVLAYLKEKQVDAPQSATDAPLAPERPSSTVFKGKIRSIKTMAPRPQGQRLKKKSEELAESERGLEEQHVQPGDEQPAELPSEVAAENVDAPVGDEVGRQATETEVAAEVAPGEVEQQPEQRVQPMSREDYISASGESSPTGGIREMKPRGAGEARKSRQKDKSAMPTLAAPPPIKAMERKKPAKTEEVAQKPDLKLTSEVFEQQSPLAAHLRKHTEKKKRDTDEEDDRKGRGPGLGLLESRQQRREKRKQARDLLEEAASARTAAKRPSRRRRSKSSSPVEFRTEAEVELPITIRGFSEALGRPANTLIKMLFERGQMVSINDNIDEETVLELAMELGVDLEIKRPRDIEDELLEMEEASDDEALLEPRPPIITILGHVDHGKTTLLDTLRSAHVADGEAGGITQHIASYQVTYNGQTLTFVDTPGHAAFGEMRARGANVTDVIVLVVAADDGVMPQTIECISHAKAAGVPIVVAMNKIDLPDVNEQKVLQELAAQDVLPSEWGGEVEVVRTSAVTGKGLDDLLETLLLTAELHEYKAQRDRPAMGVCLEAFRDEGRGAISWFIVQRGTLRIGDVVLCGGACGRIRAMYNDRDEEVTEAGPSCPVKVAGLDEVPGAGDHFFVMSELDEAREVAAQRKQKGRAELLARFGGGRRTLEDILGAAREGLIQDLPLILKADTPGSIEALRGEIAKFEHPEVRVKILHEGVGGVNESDVTLASASGAIVIAFHVIAEDRAEDLAQSEGVDIRRYNIIYEVTDEIRRILEGLLRPERVETSTGRALVLRTFHISRSGTVAGCRVLNGTIERSNRVHVIRDQTVLNSYSIASLRREKDDVKEVREGMECGIRLDGFNDVKEGDLLEAYRIEEIKRTLG